MFNSFSGPLVPLAPCACWPRLQLRRIRTPQIPQAGCRVSAFAVIIPRTFTWCPSPGSLGPASRLRRRYADAPACAFLTGVCRGCPSSCPVAEGAFNSHFTHT